MDEIFELIASVLLGVILYKINEIYKRPPVLISCDCFNDVSHDEMKYIKELYLSKKKEEAEDEEGEDADGEKVKKEE